MSIANTIETNSTVKTTAVFSKNRKDRYLLKAEWDINKKSLAIIMTYPSRKSIFRLLCDFSSLNRNFAH